METNDQIPATPTATTPQSSARRRPYWPSLILFAASLTAGSTAFVVYSLSGADPKPKEMPKGVAWSWEEVFPNWPTDQKPEFVIILTGQTHGYLQKCGCSDPQRGGLERRFNFIQGFKAHGVETIPLDLGGVSPEMSQEHRLLHQQALLKYKTAMNSMKAMGYRYVGVGKEEFELGLLEALGEFGMQNGNEQPAMLAANLTGQIIGNQQFGKKVAFPNAKGNDSAIGDWGIIPTKSKLTLGVVGIVGDPIIQDVKKIDDKIVFAQNSAKVLNEALTDLAKKKKTNLNVLLYSGPINLALNAAGAFPELGIVVCTSEESEPPARPTIVPHARNKGGKAPPDSMIIQVGHKGQNVGVVGVFRNKQGGFDLQYQLVSISPKFETPDDPVAIASNSALNELERYSQSVKNRNFLAANRKGPHPLQVSNKNAQYVGSQACAACHDTVVAGDAWKTYANSKHANAHAALVAAKKPSLRQFDGECIRCHTVGYDYSTGFVDAVKTPLLMNVGCESCHGPGSQHVANPNNKSLALELSPWRAAAGDRMPSVEKLQNKGQATAQEHATMLRVDRICQGCHNAENDPHFKIEEFWPKVAHSFKAKGGNGNNPVAPKNVDVPKDTGPSLTLPRGPDLTSPK